MRVRFGSCLLDSETRELFRDDRAVHVSPKGFQLLEVMLEKRPKALSKAELHDLLWSGTFVTDTALTVLVSEVREAIGDNARSPRFIRTVPAFGYAFSGEAVEEMRRASTRGALVHRLIGRDREIPLSPGENLIGRSPEAVLWVDDESVSRRHARIQIEADRTVLEDLGSKNGTFLNGRRIEGPEPISDGDEVRVGPMTLRFRTFRGATPTRSDTNLRPKA